MGELRIAVEGCGHGTLHSIYASVSKASQLRGWSGVDLLIIGGDFQAVRNSFDLNCMSVPMKYRHMGDFHEFYSGERVAPYLTIFIGGNHEASNHLGELYYGGWAAPNIYYMGAANVIRLGPLRIAGLSGIWKGYDYRTPHHEKIPYSADDVKSAFHQREIDVRKLLQIRTQVDIGLSHDWPRQIWLGGDVVELLRRKPFFKQDIDNGSLGSIAARQVLDRLKPFYWFSAHLHVKFSSLINYEGLSDEEGNRKGSSTQQNETNTKPKNQDEIDLDMGEDGEPAQANTHENKDEIELDIDDDDDDDEPNQPPNTSKSESKRTDNTKKTARGISSPDSANITEELRAQLPVAFTRGQEERVPSQQLPPPPGIENRQTRFLALDKCLPGRDFLQMIEIPTKIEIDRSQPLRLSYDPEWLAITRVFANELQNGDPTTRIPEDKGEAYYRPLVEAEESWVKENISQENLTVREDFEITAPVYDASQGLNPNGQNLPFTNPHTDNFCKLLQIRNPFSVSDEDMEANGWTGQTYVQGRPHGGNVRGGGYPGRGRGQGRGRGFRGGGFSGRGRGA